MPRKYLSIEGVSTFLQHTGPTTLPGVAPAGGPGETVLCLHDAGGNADVFASLLAELAGSHCPLAFDQPAHGRSAGLDSLGSIDRMVAFTAAFCAKLGLEQPVLLGHGLGAAIAMQYALEQPGSLRALVLCSSGASGNLDIADVEQMGRVSQGKERRPFFKDHYSASSSPELLRAGFMQGLKTDPRATYGDYRALAGWSVESRLGELSRLVELSLPALVVRGEHETAAVAASADALARALNGAPACVVPAAGRMLPLEQPEALAREVDAFLGGLQ